MSFIYPSVTLQRTASPFQSALYMAKKTSDRAHIERNLEDMMGNDWREFRAKLVAQEQAAEMLRQEATQQTILQHPVPMDPSQVFSHAHDMLHLGRPNPLQQQHQQQQPSYMREMPSSQRVGDLFAGAINIFDGYRISGKSLQCSDPFVSEDELPVMMQKQVPMSKHRWAHSIPYPEPGSVLISNTMFHQTVVLVISHCEVKGSTGIVINRYVALLAIGISSTSYSSNLIFFLCLSYLI
jgi:putative transcriptional regulator